MTDQLDVNTMLRASAQTQLMSKILLTEKQKLLLHFQKNKVLDSKSGTEEEADLKEDYPMKLLDTSRKKVERQNFLHYLEDMIQSYEGLQLKDVDKKLLLGIVQKDTGSREDKKDFILSVIKQYIMQRLNKNGAKVIRQRNMKSQQNTVTNNGSVATKKNFRREEVDLE